MKALFRKKAMTPGHRALAGDVLIVQPVKLVFLTAYLLLSLFAILLFLLAGSYASRETVRGILTPQGGIIKIHAPHAGVVSELKASEGLVTSKHSRLLTLTDEKTTSEGTDVKHEMRGALRTQIQELDSQLSISKLAEAAERRKFETELQGLDEERDKIQLQVETRALLVAVVQEDLEKLAGIVDKGFVSAADYLQRRENLLLQQQQLATAELDLTRNSTRIKQVQLALDQLPLGYRARLSQLQIARSELESRYAELEGRSASAVLAPISGQVTALQVQLGSSVDRQSPLMTILPLQGDLVAQLYVPTRAIGFVREGQEVRLLYDAYDHRRYGAFSGTVTTVSSSVLSPAETVQRVHLVEPTYRVTVALDEQFADTGHRALLLKSGMLLSADIVLEKHSLMQWLLRPLLAFRDRT